MTTGRLARAHSGALMGVDAVVVEVEVDMSIGLPYFNVVGLPEGAVKESKVRVISALRNAGYELPQKRITVNLAPADIRGAGPWFSDPEFRRWPARLRARIEAAASDCTNPAPPEVVGPGPASTTLLLARVAV